MIALPTFGVFSQVENETGRQPALCPWPLACPSSKVRCFVHVFRSLDATPMPLAGEPIKDVFVSIANHTWIFSPHDLPAIGPDFSDLGIGNVDPPFCL